jgi:hypothetical protein
MAVRRIQKSKSARTSTTTIKVSRALTTRIKQWSKANGDDAHAEALQVLLTRGFQPGKPKMQRTKI